METSLKNKYQKLIDAASATVSGLQVRQEGNVLYINGHASSENDKKNLWDIYNSIDPDYRSGDLVMNITAEQASVSQTEYTVVKGDNLSKIGKQFGVTWQDIYELNKDQIKNPDLIQPGWKLKIPSA